MNTIEVTEVIDAFTGRFATRTGDEWMLEAVSEESAFTPVPAGLNVPCPGAGLLHLAKNTDAHIEHQCATLQLEVMARMVMVQALMACGQTGSIPADELRQLVMTSDAFRQYRDCYPEDVEFYTERAFSNALRSLYVW